MSGTLSPQSFPSSPSFGANRSSRSNSNKTSLSIDLSSLPPLTQPSPPSNTLLITDLNDLYLFQPSSLAQIRAQLESIAPLNSFSPLPSFRRIVCSFHNEEDAITVRRLLDRESLLNRPVRTKIYFGEPTPLLDRDESGAIKHKLLEAPQVDKLFFISPPPSPPHGWVSRTEDPPNKEVHASDLAQALAMLKTEQSGANAAAGFAHQADPDTPMSMSSDKRTGSWPLTQQRSRSSTLIYNPGEHGSSPNLPAVMVEDTTADPDEMDVEMSPIEIEMPTKQAPFKTARPPVELMA
ncbi:Calcipressin-domain-containing protein [Aspergillus karnatakaensis]|uniref:putative calcineurin binding protein n=1 Tax=Aspergillus karnatakaensis TaxID=1810916 RepID=UPI003CCD4847